MNFLYTALPVLGYYRTKNVLVTVSQSSVDIFYTGTEDNLCYYHEGVLDELYNLLTCRQPIVGQFVQMQLNATTYLNIYEVEVHGV